MLQSAYPLCITNNVLLHYFGKNISDIYTPFVCITNDALCFFLQRNIVYRFILSLLFLASQIIRILRNVPLPTVFTFVRIDRAKKIISSYNKTSIGRKRQRFLFSQISQKFSPKCPVLCVCLVQKFGNFIPRNLFDSRYRLICLAANIRTTGAKLFFEYLYTACRILPLQRKGVQFRFF